MSFSKNLPTKNLIKYSTGFVFSDDKTCVFQKFYILAERLFVPVADFRDTQISHGHCSDQDKAIAVGSNIP